MNTLDVVRDSSGETPCWSFPPSGSEDSPEARSGFDLSPRMQDLEIRAYYRGRHHRILLTDVIYLRADQKYVGVRHPNGLLLVDHSLRAFERKFPDLLLRIHRNALVARSRLRGLERQPDGSTLALLLNCDDTLVVSRRHLSRVRRLLHERLESGQIE